jgi:hypothetical protein
MKSILPILALAVAAAVFAQGPVPRMLPAAGDVTLPLDEYNKLVELAGKPVKKPDTPPLPYTINRADLKLRVDGESVTGTMQLDGEVLAQGTVQVPLATGMTVLDARQQGRALPLEQEDGTHTAVLTGPGEFSLTLETGMRLSVEVGRASFKLPVPWAGAIRLNLSVPGDHTNVELYPGLITGRATSDGRTTIEATLAPGQPSLIAWAARENAAPAVPREVRFLSDVKTLATVTEAQLGIAALADITVVQGEPAQFELAIPAGYEVTGASGASLQSSAVESGVLVLKVLRASDRSHQFLVSMEKAVDAPKAEVPFLNFKGAQRETGEVLVESQGTMELTATETGGLKRMDVKETNSSLRSLAQYSLQAAFRYHRQPAEPLGLSLDWVRFPDRNVLAAVAQRAVVTTLVTSEGRSLTEVRLVVRNQAQPFLKVALPGGATILSADVAGEKVKPVEGADGNRVPLLRAGFRPTGPYTVSFVFLHSGAPFAKKGGSELDLPKMDVPIGLLQWEIFLPERYEVKDFGGDAIPASLLPPPSGAATGAERGQETKEVEAWPIAGYADLSSMGPGQMGGFVTDPSGAVVPGALVTVVPQATGTSMRAVTDAGGRWVVSNVPSGKVTITAASRGFASFQTQLDYDASRPSQFSFTLKVGSVAETVEITGRDANQLMHISPGLAKTAAEAQNAPSSNVGNLQRRVAGVLPIAVDVPHAGSSYRFVRPLVLDEETKVTFSYRTR